MGFFFEVKPGGWVLRVPGLEGLRLQDKSRFVLRSFDAHDLARIRESTDWFSPEKVASQQAELKAGSDIEVPVVDAHIGSSLLVAANDFAVAFALSNLGASVVPILISDHAFNIFKDSAQDLRAS